MGKIAQELADYVMITSDNPRTEDPEAIIQDILQGMFPDQQVDSLLDRKAAIAHAITLSQPGDTLVIAGKGHENYQVIGTQKFDFDDRQIAKELL